MDLDGLQDPIKDLRHLHNQKQRKEMKSNSQLGMTNIHLTAIWLYPIDVQQDTRVLFPQFVPGIPCLELLELLSTRLGQSGAQKNIDSVCRICSTSQETK